jgi:hypothetical protein
MLLLIRRFAANAASNAPASAVEHVPAAIATYGGSPRIYAGEERFGAL